MVDNRFEIRVLGGGKNILIFLKDLVSASDYTVMIRNNLKTMKKLLAIVCLVLMGFLPVFGAETGGAFQPAVKHPALVHKVNRVALRTHRRRHRRHLRRHRRHLRRWARRHHRTQAPVSR